MSNQLGPDKDKCASCYNWEGQVNKARAFGGTTGEDPYTCKARTREIKDCEVFYPFIQESTKTALDCLQCKSGKNHTIKVTNGTVADTFNITEHDCGTLPTGQTVCTATLKDCAYPVCWNNTDDKTNPYVQGCGRCNKSMKGDGTKLPFGYATCVAGTLANCDFYDMSDNTKCMKCADTYYVNPNDGSCMQTTDKSAIANCRVLDFASRTYCQECDEHFYFDGINCTSAAKLFSLSAILLAAMMFFN
jgi:hypothetical protein